MIAPFEHGMDIVYRSSSATNNSESAGSIAGFEMKEAGYENESRAERPRSAGFFHE